MRQIKKQKMISVENIKVGVFLHFLMKNYDVFFLVQHKVLERL